jgi:hypothetical protein
MYNEHEVSERMSIVQYERRFVWTKERVVAYFIGLAKWFFPQFVPLVLTLVFCSVHHVPSSVVWELCFGELVVAVFVACLGQSVGLLWRKRKPTASQGDKVIKRTYYYFAGGGVILGLLVYLGYLGEQLIQPANYDNARQLLRCAFFYLWYGILAISAELHALENNPQQYVERMAT